MTELLDRAITAVKMLPSEMQDAITTHLLSEIDDEQAWNLRFTTTTETQWDCLADKVRHNIAAGKTMPLMIFFRLKFHEIKLGKIAPRFQ